MQITQYIENSVFIKIWNPKECHTGNLKLYLMFLRSEVVARVLWHANY